MKRIALFALVVCCSVVGSRFTGPAAGQSSTPPRAENDDSSSLDEASLASEQLNATAEARRSTVRPPRPVNSAKIEMLRQAYAESETRARNIARRILRQKPEPATWQLRQLRQQLQAEVARSFELRRDLHQAELAAMQQKLSRARETIDQRNRLKQQIIDRRVQDLLNPDLTWSPGQTPAQIPDPAPASPAADDESEATHTPQDPPDELSGYRNFLWDALRPLQHDRNQLLSEIVELEQQLVEHLSTSPRDADEPAVAKQQQEQQRFNRTITQRMQTLQAELERVERQIGLLKRKLGEATGDPTDVVPEAALVPLPDGRVEVAVGSNDGVRLGMRLPVFRGEDYWGDVDIVELRGDTSVARIVNQVAKSPLRSGDHAKVLLDSVVSRIVGREPGEPIYNDRLRRFKFRLEKIEVTSAAEIAQLFWLHYGDRGYPAITGVWGDPQTNSIVIVGPPEADQPIRQTIAEWEGTQIGIDVRRDDSLEGRLKQLQAERRRALERIVSRKLEIIEAEAAGKDPSTGQRLEQLQSELETIDRKLQVLHESLDQLHQGRVSLVPDSVSGR